RRISHWQEMSFLDAPAVCALIHEPLFAQVFASIEEGGLPHTPEPYFLCPGVPFLGGQWASRARQYIEHRLLIWGELEIGTRRLPRRHVDVAHHARRDVVAIRIDTDHDGLQPAREFLALLAVLHHVELGDDLPGGFLPDRN